MSGSTHDHHQPRFADRHIGPDADAIETMLQVIGVETLGELAEKALPSGILDAVTVDGVAPGLDQLPPPAFLLSSICFLWFSRITSKIPITAITIWWMPAEPPPTRALVTTTSTQLRNPG